MRQISLIQKETRRQEARYSRKFTITIDYIIDDYFHVNAELMIKHYQTWILMRLVKPKSHIFGIFFLIEARFNYFSRLNGPVSMQFLYYHGHTDYYYMFEFD